MNQTAGASDALLRDNETEQKITNSDTKMSKKKKDKNAEKDKDAPSQAQIDKIVVPLRLYNKLEQNKQLTNKKGVFVNMRKYYESLG